MISKKFSPRKELRNLYFYTNTNNNNEINQYKPNFIHNKVTLFNSQSIKNNIDELKRSINNQNIFLSKYEENKNKISKKITEPNIKYKAITCSTDVSNNYHKYITNSKSNSINTEENNFKTLNLNNHITNQKDFQEKNDNLFKKNSSNKFVFNNNEPENEKKLEFKIEANENFLNGVKQNILIQTPNKQLLNKPLNSKELSNQNEFYEEKSKFYKDNSYENIEKDKDMQVVVADESEENKNENFKLEKYINENLTNKISFDLQQQINYQTDIDYLNLNDILNKLNINNLNEQINSSSQMNKNNQFVNKEIFNPIFGQELVNSININLNNYDLNKEKDKNFIRNKIQQLIEKRKSECIKINNNIISRNTKAYNSLNKLFTSMEGMNNKLIDNYTDMHYGEFEDNDNFTKSKLIINKSINNFEKNIDSINNKNKLENFSSFKLTEKKISNMKNFNFNDQIKKQENYEQNATELSNKQEIIENISITQENKKNQNIKIILDEETENQENEKNLNSDLPNKRNLKKKYTVYEKDYLIYNDYKLRREKNKPEVEKTYNRVFPKELDGILEIKQIPNNGENKICVNRKLERRKFSEKNYVYKYISEMKEKVHFMKGLLDFFFSKIMLDKVKIAEDIFKQKHLKRKLKNLEKSTEKDVEDIIEYLNDLKDINLDELITKYNENDISDDRVNIIFKDLNEKLDKFDKNIKKNFMEVKNKNIQKLFSEKKNKENIFDEKEFNSSNKNKNTVNFNNRNYIKFNDLFGELPKFSNNYKVKNTYLFENYYSYNRKFTKDISTPSNLYSEKVENNEIKTGSSLEKKFFIDGKNNETNKKTLSFRKDEVKIGKSKSIGTQDYFLSSGFKKNPENVFNLEGNKFNFKLKTSMKFFDKIIKKIKEEVDLIDCSESTVLKTTNFKDVLFMKDSSAYEKFDGKTISSKSLNEKNDEISLKNISTLSFNKLTSNNFPNLNVEN